MSRDTSDRVPAHDAGFSEAWDAAHWQRARQDPVTAETVREIFMRADDAEAQPPGSFLYSTFSAFAATGDRTAYVDLYRSRRGRLADLAIAALVDPERDTGALADLIWSICDEYQWALPAHLNGALDAWPDVPHAEQIDLGAAETAAALREITALLADRLPPLVVQRARAEVRRRVLDPFLARTHWWESADTNWASVCGASVLLSGIGLLNDDEQLRVTERVVAALESYLSGFDADGVCSEGVDYWNYGFGYFAAAAEALRENSGGAIDLWHDPTGQLSRIAAFPQSMRLSGDVVASFADTRTSASLDRGLLSRLAVRTEGISIPSAPDKPRPGDQRYRRWVLAARGLLWNADESSAAAVRTNDGASSTYFPHSQWLLVRDEGEVGFAARGGHNDELHNHNDVGSFILAARGEVLLADPGLGIYDRDYFSPHRYENPATGSQGHSVPIVDKTFQRGWARDASAQVLEIAHDPGTARFRIEFASAYDVAGLESLVRSWRYHDGELTIDDSYLASRPIVVTYRYVSTSPIRVISPGQAEIRSAGVSAELAYAPSLIAGTGTFGVEYGLLRPIYFLDLWRDAAVSGGASVTARVSRSTGSPRVR